MLASIWENINLFIVGRSENWCNHFEILFDIIY